MLNEGSATQGVPGSICSVRRDFEQTLHCVQGTPWVPQGWTTSSISESPIIVTSAQSFVKPLDNCTVQTV